MQINLNLLP